MLQSDTYNNIAVVYFFFRMKVKTWTQGKYEEALDYYNKALTIYINKLGEDHPDVDNIEESIALGT